MKIREASRKAMKKEAIKRLEFLRVGENVIKDFLEEEKIYKSVGNQPILEVLNEEERKMIEDYEKKWNVLVYHIIKACEQEGFYDLLYVIPEKECWESERERLIYGCVLAYSIAGFSESGDILVSSTNGGLVRVG